MTGFRGSLICAAAAALLLNVVPEVCAASKGDLKFSVPSGWKIASASGSRSRRQAFAITKGRAHFSVRALRGVLSEKECKAMTGDMASEAAEAGKKPAAPARFGNDSGLAGYMSSVKEGIGSESYFGYFTAGKKSYSFFLKRGDPASYKEAMTSIGLAGTAAKPKAAGRPRLTPVTYSTDKMSRPGPK